MEGAGFVIYGYHLEVVLDHSRIGAHVAAAYMQ